MLVSVLARAHYGCRRPVTRPPTILPAFPWVTALVHTNDLNSRAFDARSHCAAMGERAPI